MEESFIVTRRRRRSEANVAPEPGPSTLRPPSKPANNEDQSEGEVEVLEREVTVEEFLQWSAAGRTASASKRKTRRLVKLGAPSDDIVNSSDMEEEDPKPAPRKRKRALPQLPASDDEYEPSEADPATPPRPARRRTTYTGKARSIARDLLRAGALSGVALDTAALPALPQARRPLPFAPVRAVTPPPGVRRGLAVRVVDPRTIAMKRSVFDEYAPPRERERVRTHRVLVPPPAPPLPPGAKIPMNKRPRRRRVAHAREGPIVKGNMPVIRKERAPVVRSPLCEPRSVRTEQASADRASTSTSTSRFVFPPLTFVPVCIPGTMRLAPSRGRRMPPSSCDSFFVNLCSDEEDDEQPHSRPLSISSSPVEEAQPRADIRIAGSAAAGGSATTSDASRRIPLNQPKRCTDTSDTRPSTKRWLSREEISEQGMEVTRRLLEQQRKLSMR